METVLLREVFDLVLKRLDKLDQVLERSDTVQNVLESQNQKLDLPKTKISKVAEDSKEANQRKVAAGDVVKRFCDAMSHPVDISLNNSLSELGTCQALHKPGTGQVLREAGTGPVLTKPLNVWSDFNNEFNDKLGNLDHKIDVMKYENKLTFTDLTKSMNNIETKFKDKVMKSVDAIKEKVNSCLAEILSVPLLVRGQTKAELVWLNDQISEKLCDVGHSSKQLAQICEKLDI